MTTVICIAASWFLFLCGWIFFDAAATVMPRKHEFTYPVATEASLAIIGAFLNVLAVLAAFIGLQAWH